MSATVRFGPKLGAIILDPLNMGAVTVQGGSRPIEAKGVLLSLEGSHKDHMVHCILIPLDKVDIVIESLRLVASQVKA